MRDSTFSGTLAAHALEVLEQGLAGRPRQPPVGYRRRHIRFTLFEAPPSQPPLHMPHHREHSGEGRSGQYDECEAQGHGSSISSSHRSTI
jgi:hypothetical protein